MIKKIIALILVTALSLPLFAFTTSDKITTIQNSNVETITINDYKKLPKTIDSIDVDVSVIKQPDGKYKMTFDFKDQKWDLIVSELPHSKQEGWEDEKRIPEFMKYYTKDDKRFLFYWYQNDPSDKDIMLDIEGAINGFRPFILYAIDDNYISGVKKLVIHGTTLIKKDFAYADLLFPFDLDDLLQIRIQYQTKSTQAFFHTSVKNWEVLRINDETMDYGNFWDFFWKNWIGDIGNTLNYADQYLFGKGEKKHIERIDSEYTTSQSRQDYVTKINKKLTESGKPTTSVSKLFDSENSMWRVALQRHHDPFQTKISVTDVNVTEVLYSYKGEYFYVAQEDITSLITDAEIGTDFTDIMKNIQDFYNWLIALDWNNIIVWVVVVVIGILVIILIGPIFSLIKLIFTLIGLLFKIPGYIIQLLKWLFVPKKKKGGRKP